MARPMFRPIVLALQHVKTWPGNVIPLPPTGFAYVYGPNGQPTKDANGDYVLVPA